MSAAPRARRSGGDLAGDARPAGASPRGDATAVSEAGRTERGAATVQAFLDAAVASLVEVGYARTTIAEISRRAGVSQGLFVRYWPTKAALLAAAADAARSHAFARFEARWAETAAAELDLRARLRAAITSVVELYAEPEMRGLAELEHAARTDEQLTATLQPISASIDALIVHTARRLAPAEAAAEHFEDTVRVIIDCARGVAQRTAHAPPTEATEARAATAHSLARLLDIAD